MAIEIERKFLVTGEGWRSHVSRSARLRQGYLAKSGTVTTRIRVVDDARALLTVKAGGGALSRAEFEYEVPVSDGLEMIGYCTGGLIEKVRHTLDLPGGDWTLDVFEGKLAGLLLVEVELKTEDDPLDLPDWLGRDVSGDRRYFNSALSEADAPPDPST